MMGRSKTVLFILCLAASIFGWLAHYYVRFPGDLWVSLYVQSFQSQPLTAILESVSWVIDNWHGIVVVVFSSVVFWRLVGPKDGVLILIAGVFTAANELFKLIIDRPRPTAELVKIFIVESEKSFPSGHAFFAVAVLGLMAYLITVRQKKKLWKTLTVSVWILLTLLIGMSRIYLGVHWMSDVIGGYFFGTVFLCGEIIIYKTLRTFKNNKFV